MYPMVLPSSRRRSLFPPLPEDPVSDSSLRESEIISHDSSSSDDDTEKAAKRRRMLKHAESYLRGEPLYLHSARLRGPVLKNPWGKTVGRAKRKDSEGEGDGDGGIKKRLKRCSISEEKEDGRDILPAPMRVNKGKGILTSRGTNTIDDVIPEPSTPTPLRTRYPTAANVLGRPRSRSPVSRTKSAGNHNSELDRRDSPFNMPKQTDNEFMTTAIFKTPGKKRPERGPIEAPPVCSPSTFYNRSKSLQTSRSPQETRDSGLKSKPSTSAQKTSVRKTSARKCTKEQESISDVIVVANPTPPFLDIDLKKKRPKIDFAAKSSSAGPAPERTKPPKGKKKKISIGKENEPEVQRQRPGPVLEANSVGQIGPAKDTEGVEDTGKDMATERVLNDWLNRHVAASQDVQARGGVSKNTLTANLPLNSIEKAISAPLATAPMSVSKSTSVTTETVKITEAPIMPLETPFQPANMAIPQDTLRTLSLLETATIQLPQSEPEKAHPLSSGSDRNTISHSPTRHSQPLEAYPQTQPGPAGSGPPVSEAEEQPQSQAASWQSTQYQLLAAQKGFFDALQDSPVVFSPYHLAETPGRDLLRPISYFDNEPGVAETPRLDTDRAVNSGIMSSPSKTPAGRSAGLRSQNKDPFISPFRSTFGEGGESPSGTAFTPFRAFATPESSPKPTGERVLSPLTFTPMGAQTQQLDGIASTAKSVKFGFGLLDDDDEDGSTGGSFGSGFNPMNFMVPGQQGAGQEEDLVGQVMGFMGGGVWNIDEELKKMASGGTPGGTASAFDTGEKRKGGSTKKRRPYGRGH